MKWSMWLFAMGGEEKIISEMVRAKVGKGDIHVIIKKNTLRFDFISAKATRLRRSKYIQSDVS